MPIFADAIAAFRRRPDSRRDDGYWTYPIVTDGAIELADGLTATYSTIYRRQPWVYAGVNVLTRSVARTPLKAYTGPSDNRKRVTDGEVAVLMRNPWTYGTPYMLKERVMKSLVVYGSSFNVKLGMTADYQTPTAIMPAPPYGWRRASGGRYIWTNPRSGEEFEFERWQIIHTTTWDCDESGFGMSALEPLRMTLAVEDGAQRYAFAAFKNGARPSSVMKAPDKLAPDAAAKLKALAQQIYGGPDKAFQIAVLENGLDWAPWPAHDLEEAALINHRLLTQKEVAAALNVPQPMMGILDEANFASIDALHTILYQDSLGPWLKLIEESFQAQLIDVTPEFNKQGITLEFDMHGLMRGSDRDQYRGYATAITTGFMTPNEVRARENLPPSDQPEADMLLFPMNLSGAVGAQTSEDSSDADAIGPDSTSESSATYHQNGVAAHA